MPAKPLHEQPPIAEFLSDMDAELAALEQRRKKTRAFKQAMMQELLTGRIRLLANDTAGRDLKGLTELGLLELIGKGRAVRYVVKTTDNRPTKS